ncbi:MAG: hypothetical protein DRO11_02005 [Methanobacteriota archaeon]|nr:MAG: hypothetical protein DRO11_02005 [Euryarchaeota archaeon]
MPGGRRRPPLWLDPSNNSHQREHLRSSKISEGNLFNVRISKTSKLFSGVTQVDDTIEPLLEVIRENTKTVSNNTHILKRIEEEIKENTKILMRIDDRIKNMDSRYDKFGESIGAIDDKLGRLGEDVKNIGSSVELLAGVRML